MEVRVLRLIERYRGCCPVSKREAGEEAAVTLEASVQDYSRPQLVIEQGQEIAQILGYRLSRAQLLF